jgi:hypothetical protein
MNATATKTVTQFLTVNQIINLLDISRKTSTQNNLSTTPADIAKLVQLGYVKNNVHYVELTPLGAKMVAKIQTTTSY